MITSFSVYKPTEAKTEPMKVKGGFDLTPTFEGLFSSSPSSFSFSKRMFQARCKIWASLLPHPEPLSSGRTFQLFSYFLWSLLLYYWLFLDIFLQDIIHWLPDKDFEHFTLWYYSSYHTPSIITLPTSLSIVFLWQLVAKNKYSMFVLIFVIK